MYLLIYKYFCLKFLEFEDYKDEGRLDKISNKNITELKLKNFQWHHKNLTKHNNFVEFHTLADNYKDLESNETRYGNVTFLVSIIHKFESFIYINYYNEQKMITYNF